MGIVATPCWGLRHGIYKKGKKMVKWEKERAEIKQMGGKMGKKRQQTNRKTWKLFTYVWALTLTQWSSRSLFELAPPVGFLNAAEEGRHVLPVASQAVGATAFHNVKVLPVRFNRPMEAMLLLPKDVRRIHLKTHSCGDSFFPYEANSSIVKA